MTLFVLISAAKMNVCAPLLQKFQVLVQLLEVLLMVTAVWPQK